MQLQEEKLKKLLLESGIISAEDFELAHVEAEKSKISIERALTSLRLIPDAYLGQLVAEEFNVPFIDLHTAEIPDHVLRLVPERIAKTKRAIAFSVDRQTGLKLAMANPRDLDFIRNMEKKTGLRVKVHYALDSGIDRGLDSYTKDLESAIRSLEEKYAALTTARRRGDNAEQESKVVSVVDLIMNYAYQNAASDIHIEPREKSLVVRYRIDGILHDVAFLPHDYLSPMVTRIKILSRLRTDEHFAAQDGKFYETVDGMRIDVRVSILPIVDGEKVVMRLLSERGKTINLESLGLTEGGMKTIRRHSRKSFGMILSTGPTGSGKTTSLYAILKELNTRDVNIATIEDPIEYAIEGINQIQVNPKTGLTFATGLRSIVRQDPDIVMVGEIRDPETASIAVNAAMTGHLVLSTLHTNDAATALPRFREMEIEPFLIASTINVIVAQRLVRRICSRCIMSDIIPLDKLRENLSEDVISNFFGGSGKNARKSANLYRGKGCESCNHSGYSGRIGIYEILEMTDDIRELVMQNANSQIIQQAARKNGMITMLEDGIERSLQGITTIDEVLRVTGES
ncbi:MAG: type II/IV secretion system protein [Patescibacteria group bacterium]